MEKLKKIESLLNEVSEVKSDLEDKVEHLIESSAEIENLCSDFDSFVSSSRNMRQLKDIQRNIRDFRLDQKIERVLPDLKDDLHRQMQDEDEIDDILRDIRRI
jgi:chromosome segregation ATPase